MFVSFIVERLLRIKLDKKRKNQEWDSNIDIDI